MIRKTSFWLLATVVAAGIGSSLWLRQPQPASGGAEAPRANAVRNDTAVAVVTVKATTDDVPVRKRAIGFVETPASVVVKSRLDSQIVAQHVADGQFVKTGDLLFSLDDRDLRIQIEKDQAVLARDQATHDRAQADLSRYQQLLSRNAGTQQSVDQATADEKSTAATILSDKAALDADTLKLSYAKIKAPIDGRVGAVQVTPGNLVSASGTNATGLVTITQMKPVRVAFTLPEREVAMLQEALATGKALKVTASPADTGHPPVEGVLNFLDSSVDIASGTIAAKANFANETLALWPGQYVDVEVEADRLDNAIIVPTVAVQVGQKGSYVYVVKGDGTADLRMVKIALVDGDRSVIGEGVSAGERVVVDGQMRLKPGVRVRERAQPASDGAKPAGAQTVAAEGRS